ncbi:MAG: hypothetical protein IJ106_10505 [Parasporobacterium sp.]|nr:hypothetical protein [Parasporobacterium sp.]
MEDQKMNITTSSGYTCSIDADAMDDLEVFESIRKMQDPSSSSFVQLGALFHAFQKLIGEEQDAALRQFLAEKEGKVRTSSYKREAEEVFSEAAKNKKK